MTPASEHLATDAVAAKTWGHDELAEDLSRHLVAPARMVWLDMQLGPSGSPRPDVYTVEKSYVRPNPTAYECKISRADFRSDVTAAKWASYLEYAWSVVFAAPAGLLTKDDIPPQCGLIVRHENAWRLAKKPMPIPKAIAQEALLKLLIDGVKREGPVYRAKVWTHGDSTRRFAERFGAAAARYVADAASIHAKLEAAEARRSGILELAQRDADQIRKRAQEEAPAKWAELLVVLELPASANRFDVERVIRELKTARDGGEYAQQLKQAVASLRRIVRNAEHLCPQQTIW